MGLISSVTGREAFFSLARVRTARDAGTGRTFEIPSPLPDMTSLNLGANLPLVWSFNLADHADLADPANRIRAALTILRNIRSAFFVQFAKIRRSKGPTRSIGVTCWHKTQSDFKVAGLERRYKGWLAKATPKARTREHPTGSAAQRKRAARPRVIGNACLRVVPMDLTHKRGLRCGRSLSPPQVR